MQLTLALHKLREQYSTRRISVGKRARMTTTGSGRWRTEEADKAWGWTTTPESISGRTPVYSPYYPPYLFHE